MSDLPLDSITLDQDLQPRDQIHEDVLLEYGSRLMAGATFPPVVVYFDGARHWLADGYHRWHAHKALGRGSIDADVRQGSKRDALRHSLRANAEHGLRRGPADYRKAYGIAVRLELVEPADSRAVAEVLGCTERWAQELTREAREEERRERDAEIAERKAAGQSTRTIARDLGVDHSTVVRTSGAETKASETHHEDADPAAGNPVTAGPGERVLVVPMRLRTLVETMLCREAQNWNDQGEPNSVSRALMDMAEALR